VLARDLSARELTPEEIDALRKDLGLSAAIASRSFETASFPAESASPP